MTLADPGLARPNAPLPNRYGAMCTEVYDLDKPPGSLPDVPFYLERLAGTDGPILEAGVGTEMGSAIGMSSSFETDGFRALRGGNPWNRGAPEVRERTRVQTGDGGADQPAGGAGRDLVAEPSCEGDHGDRRHLQAMI